MEEFISSLLKGIKERNRSGFWFTFIFSWCIFNWQVIVILFFEPKESFGKHSLLDAILILNPSSNTVCAFFTSLFISALLPWIHSIIAWYNRVVLRRKEKWVLNAEGFNGPVDPQRILSMYNLLEIEKQKSLQAKIDYDNIKILKDNLEREKEDNFKRYKTLALEPLENKSMQLEQQLADYKRNLLNLNAKYLPFESRLDLKCIEFEYNNISPYDPITTIIQFAENPGRLLTFYSSSKINQMQMAFTNNFIYLNDVKIEILSINSTKVKIGELDFDGSRIFIELPLRKPNDQIKAAKIEMIIIDNIYVILFYGYFENKYDTAKVFFGKP